MKLLSSSILFSLTSVAFLGACTGALDKNQIRQGNYNAPPELQVAENCKSADAKQECKVIISHPPKEEKTQP
jgi:hypothetical protein